MKLFNAIVLAFAMFLSTGAGAQGIADPTDWSYEVKKKGINEYQLVFKVTLKEGWHIFSLRPGDDFLIPPSFSFAPNGTVKMVGKVTEHGTLKTERMEGVDQPVRYYEKTAEFIQVVKARPGAKITGEHEYQVCNNMMCLPPKTKGFEFVVRD